MRKKSILYIITKSAWGGAAKYVYDLSVNMSNDFDVSVAAGGKNILAQRLIETGIPYFEINHFQRNINLFKELFISLEILYLLFKLKPDIIHVNSSKAGGIAGFTVKIYKILSRRSPKMIFTAHGWAFSEDRPKAILALIKFLSKLTALFYDKIICVSKYDKKIALKNRISSAEKLTVIYNGLDAKTINFLPLRQAQKRLLNKIPQPNKLVIGTIAEWTKNKGITYLLEAIKIIESKGYKSDIVLIGSGENPDKDKLYHYIKNNLNNFYLHEQIPNAASYLKTFDIFILPSVKEGLPYVILEAVIAGIPIIATNVGGIPEILTQQCLVQPKNSQQLAERIIYFINNLTIARETAEKIRKRTIKRFCLAQMIKKTKSVYARV